MMRFLVVTVFLIFLGLGQGVFAGVVMLSKHTSNGKVTENSVYLSERMMRVEMDQGVYIFRGDQQLFWILDHGTKSYREMNEAEMNRLNDQITESMKQVEEQLKNLPPEQRAMMEKMLKGQMKGMGVVPNEEVKKPVYEKVGSGEHVQEWVCDKYEQKQDGVREADIWTVPYAEVKLGAEDFQVFQDMAAFLKKLPMGQQSGQLPFEGMGDDSGSGFSGVPVKQVFYANGAVESQWELEKVEKRELEASLFELPADYVKKGLGE